TQVRIVNTKGHGAAVVDGGMVAKYLLYILGVNVLASHDDQILLSADNVKLSSQGESKVTRAVPIVLKRFGSQIRTVVVTLEQTITANQDFADTAWGQVLSGWRSDAYLGARKTLARRHIADCAWPLPLNRPCNLLFGQDFSIEPDARRIALIVH